MSSELSLIPLYDGMPHYLDALSHYEPHGFTASRFCLIRRSKQQSITELDCVLVNA